jgi:uncharacterized protein
VKFITDSNLGKLAKWLRILGYDTTYYTGNVDHVFLRKAEREGRVALTRKRDVAERQYSGQMVIIQQERVENQLRELINKLCLEPEPEQTLKRCLRCNEALRQVSREEVAGLVPDYIFMIYKEFHMCPQCGGIFWPGTHKANVDQFLKTRIRRRSP